MTPELDSTLQPGAETSGKLALLAAMIAFAAASLAIATFADQPTSDVFPLSVIGYNLTILLLGFTAFIGWLAVRSR